MPDSFVLAKQARADLDSIIVYIAKQSGSVETAFRVDDGGSVLGRCVPEVGFP